MLAVVIIPSALVSRRIPQHLREWNARTVSEQQYLERRVTQLRSIQAHSRALRIALDSLRNAMQVREQYLSSASTKGVAGAGAVAAVARYTRDARFQLSSISVLPPRDQSQDYEVGRIRLVGGCDAQGLLDFIGLIERDKGGMKIESLALVQPEPTVADGAPDALRIDLTIAVLLPKLVAK